MAAPRALELFAGGGGMALGMGRAGFGHAALVEWWKPAASVLRRNAGRHSTPWSADRVYEQDARKTDELLERLHGVNLVAAGPPCQPFSLAGVHAGYSDERNMFPAAIEYVRRLRPEIVVFENVPGLLRASFAPYLNYVKAQLASPGIVPKEGEFWFEHERRIAQSSAASDYFIYQQVLDAADYGVGQCRKRVFLVAIRKDVCNAEMWAGMAPSHSLDALLYEQFVSKRYWEDRGLRPRPVPARLARRVALLSEAGQSSASLKPWVTLRDVLTGVPRPGSKAPAGWPDHIAIPGARTYRNHTGSPLDLPSKTIKAGVHGVAGGEAMLRTLSGSVRYLTVREAAMVQGFPREYEFAGPRSRMMGVIGNAVAVEVARSLGASLRTHTNL